MRVIGVRRSLTSHDAITQPVAAHWAPSTPYVMYLSGGRNRLLPAPQPRFTVSTESRLERDSVAEYEPRSVLADGELKYRATNGECDPEDDDSELAAAPDDDIADEGKKGMSYRTAEAKL